MTPIEGLLVLVDRLWLPFNRGIAFLEDPSMGSYEALRAGISRWVTRPLQRVEAEVDVIGMGWDGMRWDSITLELLSCKSTSRVIGFLNSPGCSWTSLIVTLKLPIAVDILVDPVGEVRISRIMSRVRDVPVIVESPVIAATAAGPCTSTSSPFEMLVTM